MIIRSIVSLLATLILCSNPVYANTLRSRVEIELANFAGETLSAESSISIVDMTPVRGNVKTISVKKFDNRSGYFEAIVGNGNVQRNIAGRAQTLVPLVVPVRSIRAGETVGSADFKTIFVPINTVPVDPVEDINEVEGFQARRSLAAGRPFSEKWLGAPFVISRNDIVSVSFQSAHIRLLARGRALEDGAVGDVIRAIHVDGGTLIEGVVTGPNSISVR